MPRGLQVLLIGGTAVSHLLHLAITAAIMVAVVIGVMWTVAALLYLGGLVLSIGRTPHV